jgi:uncharacterized protein (TIGR02594 family)
MKKIELTLYEYSSKFIGTKEVLGEKDNPLIQWWLALCKFPYAHDEVAWCSAAQNGMCFGLSLPMTYSAAARSWLKIGTSIKLEEAEIGFDVVILKRGTGDQPGPEVIDAPGHVGNFAGIENNRVKLLAGNQGNSYCISSFPIEQILGIRRLY